MEQSHEKYTSYQNDGNRMGGSDNQMEGGATNVTSQQFNAYTHYQTYPSTDGIPSNTNPSQDGAYYENLSVSGQQEWFILAMILDRLFFACGLIFLSVCFIGFLSYMIQEGALDDP